MVLNDKEGEDIELIYIELIQLQFSINWSSSENWTKLMKVEQNETVISCKFSLLYKIIKYEN